MTSRRLQSIPISSASSRSRAVIGMMPLLQGQVEVQVEVQVQDEVGVSAQHLPTPTGMWSKRDWASCSFTGATSSSRRFVLGARCRCRCRNTRVQV